MKVVIVGYEYHLGKATEQYLQNCDLWGTTEEGTFRNLYTNEILEEVGDADYVIYCTSTKVKVTGHKKVIRYTLPLDAKNDEDYIYWPTFITSYDKDEQRIVMSDNAYLDGFCKLINRGIHFLSFNDTKVTKLYADAMLATRVELFNNVADVSDNPSAVINAISEDRRIGNFYNYPERKPFTFNCKSLATVDPIVNAVVVSNSNRV